MHRVEDELQQNTTVQNAVQGRCIKLAALSKNISKLCHTLRYMSRRYIKEPSIII